MVALPHDGPDLFLAPVVLDVDARVAELGRCDREVLRERIALVSDTADWTRELREIALLKTVGRDVDCHGWQLSWDVRGIRLSHDRHQVVLGVPPSFVQFLAGDLAPARSVPTVGHL